MPFGIVETKLPSLRSAMTPSPGEARLPEVERLLRRYPPDDPVHHSGPGPAGARTGVLEEGDVGAGTALLVTVEEVVDGRVVLVHRLLDEPEAEEPA